MDATKNGLMLAFLVSGSSCFCGCTDVPPEPTSRASFDVAQEKPVNTSPRANERNYEQIRGDGASVRPVGLCELLHFYTAGAGKYVVKKLTGVTEELREAPGHFDGFTYVELQLVDDWSGASPPNPTIRITGGPISATIQRNWQVSLAVGETIGILIEAPRPENENYYGLHELTVFKQGPDGGYSNGHLFRRKPSPVDHLGRLVRRLVANPKLCLQEDVLPDPPDPKDMSIVPLGAPAVRPADGEE